MKWSSKKPTEPGWYWFCGNDETPYWAGGKTTRVAEVARCGSKRTPLLAFMCGGAYEVEKIGGEWAGPIDPPEN